jgi:hypothetical protein
VEKLFIVVQIERVEIEALSLPHLLDFGALAPATPGLLCRSWVQGRIVGPAFAPPCLPPPVT